MERRHFLVRECDKGEYELREIEPAIGEGIRQFGTITGQCRAIKSVRWTFYFMNTHLSDAEADTIAEELTQDFLAGRR